MDCLQWVQPQLDEILGMPNYRDVLQIKVFLTRAAERVHMASRSRAVQIVSARCDVGRVVEEVWRERVGAMGVVVCGPGAFADGVRSVCRERVREGSLEFVEEGFSY